METNASLINIIKQNIKSSLKKEEKSAWDEVLSFVVGKTKRVSKTSVDMTFKKLVGECDSKFNSLLDKYLSSTDYNEKQEANKSMAELIPKSKELKSALQKLEILITESEASPVIKENHFNVRPKVKTIKPKTNKK